MPSTFSFGEALHHLRSGRSVTRKGWNGAGQSIKLVTFENEKLLPYLEITTVQDQLVPWLASQTDILADDWELV